MSRVIDFRDVGFDGFPFTVLDADGMKAPFKPQTVNLDTGECSVIVTDEHGIAQFTDDYTDLLRRIEHLKPPVKVRDCDGDDASYLARPSDCVPLIVRGD